MKRATIVVFSAAAAVLAGCGFGSNPTDAVDFKAPSGWTSPPSFFGTRMWLRNVPAPADSKSPGLGSEIVILVKAPRSKEKGDLGFLHDLGPTQLKGQKLEGVQATTICGNHPAEYAVAEGTANGSASTVELVTTVWGEDRYVAAYVRKKGAAPAPEAETAIRSICAKNASKPA